MPAPAAAPRTIAIVGFGISWSQRDTSIRERSACALSSRVVPPNARPSAIAFTSHAQRPGFCISELQIAPMQKVPWHYHTNVQDTFYVLEGRIRLFLREPKEEVMLGPGETYAVRPRRPHLVTNAGRVSAVFLVLQGMGEYDFVPLT